MKKIISIFCLLLVVTLVTTGCSNGVKRINGNLEDLMTKVYNGISSEELPMGLQNITLNEDNLEYYIGTSDIKWEEALASESLVGSIAHSVVLVRMAGDATQEDIEEAKKKIEENVNPRKWVCVEAENVIVESNGNLIILIMGGSISETLEENFNNLL